MREEVVMTKINSSLQVTPIIRAINEGTPAGLWYFTLINTMTQTQQCFTQLGATLRQNIDGSLKLVLVMLSHQD